jgi:hypothetical protein
LHDSLLEDSGRATPPKTKQFAFGLRVLEFFYEVLIFFLEFAEIHLLFLCQTGAEFLDLSYLVHEFFLAGKEGMARGAHLNLNGLFGCSNAKGIAASAAYLCLWEVLGVDILFHMR